MSLNFKPYGMVRHGEVLAGREAGRSTGREVQSALEDSGALLLSFEGVRVASPSYLEEVLRGVRAALVGGDTKRMLLLGGLESEDVKEAIEFVLEKLKMTMAAMNKGQVELLGGSQHLSETFRAARELGSFRVPDLAAELKIKLPALHQRLQALLESGAIVRTEDPVSVRGRSHVYTTQNLSALELAERSALA